MSIPGLFDAIGWFTDEELVETVDVRLIAVGVDFATILSSSFCSCILFAIVLEQLVMLKILSAAKESCLNSHSNAPNVCHKLQSIL